MIKQRIVQGLAAGMLAATLLCGATVQDTEASTGKWMTDWILCG